VLVVAFIVAGYFIGASLYQGRVTSTPYQYGGFTFYLTSQKDSHPVATITSATTTAPVKAKVRAIPRIGDPWTDLLAWVKGDWRTYPVTRVTGLTSKARPIDLSELATDTVVALNGQLISYSASGYSFEATQAGGTLTVKTASAESTATLPARLFADDADQPLAVKLSPAFEATLLDKATAIAGEQVAKSSEYTTLRSRIEQVIQPYSRVISASATQAVQAKLDDLKRKETQLADYEGTQLDVPLISQLPEFPAGCEAASTAMLITYGGHTVSTDDIVEAMPYASNPSDGYVGNPRKMTGWTIFPSAMKSVVKQYLGTGVDLTGCNLETIYEHLRAGKPVVCWLGGNALPGVDLHCVCVTGYGKGMIYYNDPYLNIKNKAVSASTFTSWWAVYGNRALSY